MPMQSAASGATVVRRRLTPRDGGEIMLLRAASEAAAHTEGGLHEGVWGWQG